MPEIEIWKQYYCTQCREIVGIHPGEHRQDEHDGDLKVDIIRITDREDEQLIAQSDDMGHFGPHMWDDVEGHEMCVQCGAVKIPEETEDKHAG